MSNIATLLHISDLHFDDELTERGRRHWKRNLGVKSHSFGKVDALSAKLFALLGIGIVPNILLVTGDVTTDGSPGSLEVAREFLEESEIFRGNPGRLVTLGLNAKKRERIVVPGNHDRYVDSRLPYQSQNDGLEKVFAMPSRYPHVFCFRPPGRPSDATEPALLFFVFDSSAPLSRTQDKAPWVRIARGRIEDAECRWLVAQASTIRDSGSAPDLTGEKVPVDYDNAIRIAVLHHHPIKRTSSGLFDRWTAMENGEKFVDACFEAGVDLVMFGHQHERHVEFRKPLSEITEAFSGRGHGIHFLCCPSTLEFSETDNGFWFLDFQTDHFLLRSYSWNGSSFVTEAPSRFVYDRIIGIRSASGRG